MNFNTPFLGAMAMSILVTVVFAGMLLALCFGDLKLSPVVERSFFTMLGVVGTAFMQAVNFWLGSSSGSVAKGDALSEIAKGP